MISNFLFRTFQVHPEVSTTAPPSGNKHCCWEFKWVFLLTTWVILTTVGLGVALWWLTQEEDCLTDLCRYGTAQCTQNTPSLVTGHN